MAESQRKLHIIVAGCLVLFAILVANVVLYVVQNTKAVNDNTRRREALELSNCIASNVRSQATRTAIEKSLVALVPPGAVLSTEQLAQITAYNKAVEAQLPYRDCSPAGITFYIEHPPADPAAPAAIP